MKLLSRVRLLVIPWTAAYQAPPSMGVSRQEYWSGSPVPSPKGPQMRQLLSAHHHHNFFFFFFNQLSPIWASLVAQTVKNPPAVRETWVQSLGWEDPLEKGKGTHSSLLAWRTPWTVQFMGSEMTEQLSLLLSYYPHCLLCLFGWLIWVFCFHVFLAL